MLFHYIDIRNTTWQYIRDIISWRKTLPSFSFTRKRIDNWFEDFLSSSFKIFLFSCTFSSLTDLEKYQRGIYQFSLRCSLGNAKKILYTNQFVCTVHQLLDVEYTQTDLAITMLPHDKRRKKQGRGPILIQVQHF